MNQTAIKPAKISSPVIGMGIFVFTEVMFFLALISAFLVIKAGTPEWSIPDGITLPIYTTLFNTFLLFLSGYFLWSAGNYHVKKNLEETKSQLTKAAVFGLIFVAIQGYEWVQLIQYGMTMHSGIFGACFYLLIGSHGLHALMGAIALLYFANVFEKTQRGTIHALMIFWFLVVGIWPVLFGLVYF